MVCLTLQSVVQGVTSTSIRYTAHEAVEVDGELLVGDPIETCTVNLGSSMTLEEVNVWLETRKNDYT